MKKGENYGWGKLETFAEENNFKIEELNSIASEHNRFIVGESFLILRHQEKDIIISLILTGGSNHEYIYDCIYSDF